MEIDLPVVQPDEYSVDPPEAARGELYRASPFVRFHLDGRRQLVYLPLRRKAVILSQHQLSILLSCVGFKTLSDHASAMRARGIESGADEIAKLVDIGVLLSDRDLLANLTQNVDVERKRIEWLAIPTNDRPEKLQQALETFLPHLRRYGRSPSVFVSDDSRDEATCSSNRAIVLAAAQSFGPIYYCGQREKLQFVNALAEEGLPLPVLRFALFGHAHLAPVTGGNRNAILLRTSRALALSVDDDILCRPGHALAISLSDTVHLAVEDDPTEFWFFADRSSALASVVWKDIDILAAHEQLLGSSIPGLLADVELRPILQLTCPHQFLSLGQSRGRVRVTYNGTVGDSAAYSADPMITSCHPGTRERLLCSEEVYRQAITSREVLRQARVRTVGHVLPCVAACMGLDNRELLPPFFPIGRNQDGLFGYMLEVCAPESYAARLPLVLPHLPPQVRTYHENTLSAVRISDIVRVSIASWCSVWRPTDSGASLLALGRHLCDLADLDAEEFREFLAVQLRRAAAEGITQRESLLRRFAREPKYWAADIQRHIDAACDAVTTKGYTTPSDINVPEPLTCAQDLVKRFGELLSYWPAINERTEALVAQGVELGMRLE